jgi:hypothetical protein
MDEFSSSCENEGLEGLLRTALGALALPAVEQVGLYGPACIACELLTDFDNARRAFLANRPEATKEQRRCLDEMDRIIGTMVRADFECWNKEIVRRPIWQEVREFAASALAAFGWSDVRVKPSVEIRPGLWIGPTSEC